MVLLWGYTGLAGIAAIAVAAAFIGLAPDTRQRGLDLAWLVAAVAIVGPLFLWKLVLQFQAVKVCYGLSGRRLLGVIAGAVVLYALVVAAESSFVDDRGPVPGDSLRAMSPTLRPSMMSRSFVSLSFDRFAYRVRSPRRGEVVGFVSPGSPESFLSGLLRARVRFVGRVVGVPGDEAEVRGGRVYLNGQPSDEPHRVGGRGMDLPPTRLGADQYLVLGDNRDMPVHEYHAGVVTERDFRGRLSLAGRLKWSYLAGERRW